MYNMTGSIRTGARLAALASAMLIALGTTNVTAETVKTVNGTAIDSSVLNFYMESRAQKPLEQVTAEERTFLLQQLVDLYLLSTGEAAEQAESDPDLKAQIELQYRGTIAQVVAGKLFDEMQISEEAILAAYDTQLANAPPRQFKARHILLESQGEAMQVIGELDIGGNFESLAKERSTGPSGPTGGDLGWFSPTQMVKAFSDAVQQLENGKYTTTPVQTQFGWHVILREDSRQTEAPTLDSLRETIMQSLQQEKFDQHLQTLRSAMEE